MLIGYKTIVVLGLIGPIHIVFPDLHSSQSTQLHYSSETTAGQILLHYKWKL